MASAMDPRKSNSKPLLESQLDLLREGRFSDVTFVVGKSKERIPCHQLFLKARSSVFEVMFNERWNQDKELVLEDVEPKIFHKFLQFIYSDTFAADVPEALELLQLAHMYDVQLLVSKCEKLLESQVTLDTALEVFQAARKFDKFELMDKVGDLWATSTSKLQSLPYFSRLDKDTLMYILKRNDLNTKEVDVFRLVEQWMKDQTGLTESPEDILSLIRFPTMTLKEFTATVVPAGLLSQSTLIELFKYFGSDAESKKSLASSLKFSTQPRAHVVKSPVVDAVQKVDVIQIVDKAPKNEMSRLPLVYVIDLYQVDFDRCYIEQKEYTQLKECLEFDIYDESCWFLDEIIASEAEKSRVALKSISFYCPKTSDSKGLWHLSTKRFRIILKSKRRLGENYKQVVTKSDLDAEEGEITEVKLKPVVPMKNDMRYCIIIEEMDWKAWRPQDKIMYEAKKFKHIRVQVTISMGEKSLKFKNIQRNEVSEFQDYYSERGDAKLIYKLGLEECKDFKPVPLAGGF